MHLSAVDPEDESALGRAVSSHLLLRRWASAYDAISAFLERHPTSVEALTLSGDVSRDEWALAAARASYERALAIDSGKAEARAGLAFVQIVSGQIDEGIANCRWVMQQRSDLAAPRRHLASALLLRGQPLAAAEHALEARRLAPLRPENTTVLAATWFRCGLRAGARRLIDRVLATHDGMAEAWVTRASFKYANGDNAGAREDLDRGLALKPGLAPAHAMSARLYASAGQVDQAFAAIAQARLRNPGSEEYLLLEAEWLAATGRRVLALDNCLLARARHPKSRELKARIAMWSLEENRVEQARRHVSGLLPAAEASAIWRRLGAVWTELGVAFGAEALTCLLHAMDADRDPSTGVPPRDPEVLIPIAELSGRLRGPEFGLPYLEELGQPAAAALAAGFLERLNRRDDALDRLRTAVAVYPNDAFAAMHLGMALRRRGLLTDAEAELTRASILAPDEPAVREQLAITVSDAQRFDDALTYFRRAAELSPDSPSIRFNIAILLARARRWTEAERAFRQIVQADPSHVEAMSKLAHVLAQQKRFAEAIEWLEIAAERVPDDVSVREALIVSYRSLHRIDAAAEAARQWVDDTPDSFHAVAMFARQLAAQKDPAADAVADRAWALSPDSVRAIEMRAEVATQTGRYREAVDWLDRGLDLAPDNITLLTLRGHALQDIGGDSAESEAMGRRVLALAPEIDHAPVNLSLLVLRQGAFEEAWRLYDERDTAIRAANSLITVREHVGHALDLSHASVYVRAEQGLGDTLQFMRYVALLAREAREVLFQMQDSIVWAARDIAPNVRVYGYQDAVPHADYQIALMSLPRYYATDLESIPVSESYIRADAALEARWREQIGTAGFRIGIVWQTDPFHGNARRWMPLRFFAPLAGIPGVRLISLQKFHGLDQLRALPSSQPVEELGDDFDSGPDAFVDTAAVMNTLDLVISIDTSMAHLAGAMGRPVWVVLHRTSDWRWLTDRTDSPWYPTMRLFRQDVADDWAPVSAELVRRVRAVVAGAEVP